MNLVRFDGGLLRIRTRILREGAEGSVKQTIIIPGWSRITQADVVDVLWAPRAHDWNLQFGGFPLTHRDLLDVLPGAHPLYGDTLGNKLQAREVNEKRQIRILRLAGTIVRTSLFLASRPCLGIKNLQLRVLWGE